MYYYWRPLLTPPTSSALPSLFSTATRLKCSTTCTLNVSDSAASTDRQSLLVKGGWWYRKYAPGDTALEEVEKEAGEARKGL